jgi:hypothetical protein
VHDLSSTLAEAKVVVTWLTPMLRTAKFQLRNLARRLVILTDAYISSVQPRKFWKLALKYANTTFY